MDDEDLAEQIAAIAKQPLQGMLRVMQRMSIDYETIRNEARERRQQADGLTEEWLDALVTEATATGASAVLEGIIAAAHEGLS